MNNIDKRAQTRWEKSDISYNNYQDYLERKTERFKLSLIDLFYISNFKGGNATIQESEKDINRKLIKYSDKLQDIFFVFGTLILSDLNNNQINLLISKVDSFCDLTDKNTDSQIDGFSISYLSALLNSYFPNLIPIIDRRILINLNLVTNNDIEKKGQIKNIRSFYGKLIEKMAELCRKGKSIREIDRQYFEIKITMKTKNNEKID